MTTKNIVNIQNNRLDFYVNGTNRFDVTLKGTNALRVTQDSTVNTGFQIRAVDPNNIFAQDTTANFLGNISNIDNHDIGDLSNVNTNGATADDLLVYDGTKWTASDPTNIQSHSINLLSDVDTSGAAVDHVLQYDGTKWMSVGPTNVGATTISMEADTGGPGTFNILSDTLTINGTDKQIDTGFDGTSVFTLSVPTNFTVPGSDSDYSYIQIGDDNANSGIRINRRHTGQSGMSTILNTALKSDETHKYGIGLGNGGSLVLNYSGINPLEVLYSASASVITCSTNGNVRIHEDLTINGDTTIDQNLVVHGNFTVNGTTTYISTEHKLIEDPMIELNFGADGTEGNDVGFYGVIRADNYGGFFYDSDDNRFKMFDSYPTNPTNVAEILTTNANFRLANLNVREIELTDGQVCETIASLVDVAHNTQTSINCKTKIIDTIKSNSSDGTNYMLLSGKLISSVYQGTNNAAASVMNFILNKMGTSSDLQMTTDNEYINTGNDWGTFTIDTDNNTLTVQPNNSLGNYSLNIKMLTISRIGIE